MAADGHVGSYEMTQEEADNEVAVEIYGQLQERAESLAVDAAVIAEREERIQVGNKFFKIYFQTFREKNLILFSRCSLFA